MIEIGEKSRGYKKNGQCIVLKTTNYADKGGIGFVIQNKKGVKTKKPPNKLGGF